jgi:hypothetical protein
MLKKIPLTPTEEAYLTLVTSQHAAQIQAADAMKNERVNILLTDKGIPLGIPVGAEARTADTPACLTYDDGTPTVEDPPSPSAE